jgi:hypothetical protein
MQIEKTGAELEALALREARKRERRAAMEECKRLHAIDPEKGREAARRWFEANSGVAEAGQAGSSPFHERKHDEADPERIKKAAEAVRKGEADSERAQNASRDTLKEWRKRNPNKVKKLSKMYKERQKSK